MKDLQFILENYKAQSFDGRDFARIVPLFKATSLKYGFNNPIGDDEGNEPKYGNK